MTARSTPGSTWRSGSLAVVVGVVLLLVGLCTPAAAATRSQAPAPLATTTTVTVTSSHYSLGQSARATATVRDRAGHSARGTITFRIDGHVFARTTVGALGRGVATVPASAVGRHVVTATYVPAANAGHTGSSGAKALDVVRARVNWTVTMATPAVYFGTAVIRVVVRGYRPVAGRVSLVYNGRTIQRLIPRGDGSMIFRVKATWPAGNARMSVFYPGNAYYAPARKLLAVGTRKATTTVGLSAPSTVGYEVGSSARISVSGAGRPSGAVTLLVDGQARSATRLTGGLATLPVPGLPGGRHTVTVSYAGDANHSGATRSMIVTAAVSADCPVSASACVDLTHSVTWLQSGGRITYGPVAITSGRPGYRTPPGSFSVYWKDIDHHSSEFNNAPMPYSVFFNGGVAFHEGSLSVQSHGCVHLSASAARTYYNTLHNGDRVVVFGVAPY